VKQVQKNGRLFVYGTLMQGMENHFLLAPYVKAISPATLRGRLLVLTDEGYPMLFAGDEIVHGELVDLTDEAVALELLDPFEGFVEPGHSRNLYERCQVAVMDQQGDEVIAWVYICPPQAEQELWAVGGPIADGNWRTFTVNR
jgi:gamma-glutamylcyclotransferase (GGCT)/AIG2-like uncharacterized protein YtfP